MSTGCDISRSLEDKEIIISRDFSNEERVGNM